MTGHEDVKQRAEEKSSPFNRLFWIMWQINKKFHCNIFFSIILQNYTSIQRWKEKMYTTMENLNIFLISTEQHWPACSNGAQNDNRQCTLVRKSQNRFSQILTSWRTMEQKKIERHFWTEIR